MGAGLFFLSFALAVFGVGEFWGLGVVDTDRASPKTPPKSKHGTRHWALGRGFLRRNTGGTPVPRQLVQPVIDGGVVCLWDMATICVLVWGMVVAAGLVFFVHWEMLVIAFENGHVNGRLRTMKLMRFMSLI